MSGPILSWLFGLGLFAIGERYASGSSAHLFVSVAGLLLIGLALGLRFRESASETHAVRKTALRGSMMWMLLGTFSIVIYLASTDSITGMLGMVEETKAWWYVVATAMSALCLVLGVVPTLFIDRALVSHPVQLPVNAQRLAANAGIVTALALALFPPVNYLASEHSIDWDYAYFRTTRAGQSTMALVRTLPDPVEVVLFYPRGNEVLRELEPYFEQLADASDGHLTVRVVDQALERKLSEKLRINDNGYIVFTQGEASEKWKVGTELDRAKRNLKKLDLESQKRLLKLAKGERTVYLLSGHGEASTREKENPARKLSQFKKKLQEQGLLVKEYGATEGSTDSIPDDTAFLVIAAPSLPISEYEEKAIAKFIEGGGSLMVLVEPRRDPLPGVLGPLGLKVTPQPLANETKYFRQSGTIADRQLLATNRYGSHDAVRELQRNAQRYRLLLPTVGGLEKEGEGLGKQTAIVRSFPDTWLEDAPVDFQRSPTELAKVWDLGVAVEGEGEDAFRAVVFADESVFSDAALKYSEGNERLAEDVSRWLMGDEDLAGDTESEEDVKVAHTRDQDIVWFLASAFGIPLLFVFAGLFRIRMRRK
ncbi:MAG: Gldg family protein [Proteobacteria bacterium]|nr:Gldg family protein [Pseudomonadota bacterium]